MSLIRAVFSKLHPLNFPILVKNAFFVGVLLLMMPFHQVFATERAVVDLYSAKALVKSQSEAERNKAANSGLSVVAVRASGRSDAASHPAIQEAARHGQNYLFGFSYSGFTHRLTEGDKTFSAMELGLKYSPEAISQLLRDAELPVWPNPRPAVLVWMVSKTSQGVHAQISAELIEKLNEVANARGLPLIFAAQDIEDQLSISPEGLWSFDRRQIELASLRYKADAVLVMRLTPQSLGFIPQEVLPGEEPLDVSSSSSSTASSVVELDVDNTSSSEGDTEVVEEPWYVNWELLHGSVQLKDTGTLENYSALSSKVINQLTDALAKQYSMNPSAMGPQSYVVQVNGIKNFTAFKKVQDYLSGLAVINAMSVIKSDAGSLTVRVETDGDIKLLLSTLGLGDYLQPMSDVNNLLNGVVAPSSDSDASTADSSYLVEDEEALARALDAELESGSDSALVTPTELNTDTLGTSENPLVYLWLR